MGHEMVAIIFQHSIIAFSKVPIDLALREGSDMALQMRLIIGSLWHSRLRKLDSRRKTNNQIQNLLFLRANTIASSANIVS